MNEQEFLKPAVQILHAHLLNSQWSFEILLAENGSRDQTLKMAMEISQQLSAVRYFSVPGPNYGLALKTGILTAVGEIVVCDEIDLGDIEFYVRAIKELDTGADLVVGSKRHAQSQDRRPWLRRLGTWVINALLRIVVGFQGTDTHGLKIFRRSTMLPVVNACRIEHHVFASELVLRAYRMGRHVREIPVQVNEKRPPSVHLLKRVPRVLWDLLHLMVVIRFKP